MYLTAVGRDDRHPSILEKSMVDLSVQEIAASSIIAAGAAAVIGLLVAFRRRIFGYWIESSPDEMILIVRQGTLIASGVGSRFWHVPLLGRVPVRFTTTLQRVTFSADNITSEKQGVQISGFVLWRVNPAPDSSFTAYKTLGFRNTLEFPDLPREERQRCLARPQHHAVREIIQSVVRNYIANATIQELISSRETVRQKLIADLREIMTPWGIIVDNAELSAVNIMSATVFANLQATFRESLRYDSETAHAEAQQKLDMEEMQRAVAKARERDASAKEEAVTKTRLALETEEENAKLIDAQNAIREKQMQQQTALRIMELDSERSVKERQAANERDLVDIESAIAMARLGHELQRRELKEEADIRIETGHLKIEESKSDRQADLEMARRMIETAAEAARAVKLSDVRWTSVSSVDPLTGAFTQILEQLERLKGTAKKD